ncbi:glucosamine-6-phosphate deaminase [Desertihabitans brevis]|uniref:Glucosamine-6-phosphate deaminase n=1 Tax=Desertihabitans brevis TaxID=2268447 RepID=A0A367YQ88_9ACTN|nr:glucosamine-6-phosphate deaminase [Desertihabitans brevis]RCK68055.1 glucosamine-6-phosphate deaminase [Desertihabitans brevis]
MEVIICPDADEVGRVAAAKVARVCADEERPVLGLATGSSPLAIYAHLAAKVEAGELDLSAVDAFALDEYVGLDRNHPESYASVIARTVTEPLRMDPARVHVPDGAAEDIEAAAEAYERAISEAGGVSVQILGIGTNGHIGFNEPTSSFSSRTRIKTLAERTRLDNQRFFSSLEEVPTHCLTQGLGTIMDARHVLLVAQGAAKADAVAATVEGPVSAVCPASILQHHRRATVVLDEAAASGLRLRGYYQHVYAHKPGWQRFA